MHKLLPVTDKYPTWISGKERMGVETIWATIWQNQQNGMCAQQRLRSALADNQPGHLPSLIKVFTVRSMEAFFMRTAKTLIKLGRCPGWSESLLGTRHFVGFVMGRLISLPISMKAMWLDWVSNSWHDVLPAALQGPLLLALLECFVCLCLPQTIFSS